MQIKDSDDKGEQIDGGRGPFSWNAQMLNSGQASPGLVTFLLERVKIDLGSMAPEADWWIFGSQLVRCFGMFCFLCGWCTDHLCRNRDSHRITNRLLHWCKCRIRTSVADSRGQEHNEGSLLTWHSWLRMLVQPPVKLATECCWWLSPSYASAKLSRPVAHICLTRVEYSDSCFGFSFQQACFEGSKVQFSLRISHMNTMFWCKEERQSLLIATKGRRCGCAQIWRLRRASKEISVSYISVTTHVICIPSPTLKYSSHMIHKLNHSVQNCFI